MKKRIIGQGLEVSSIGLGCMGMSEFYGETNDTSSLKVLHKATELGVDFFDTSDMYGPYKNEELIGRFLKETSSPVQVATKFGIRRDADVSSRSIDNSPEYTIQCCENSLKRLGIDCIDLFYIHRIDKTRPIEEAIEVLGRLVQQGKIKHIGLSEVSAQNLRRAHAVHPITAVQSEYSLWTRDVENEVLPTCRELGIGFVPYSPLGRGFLTGRLNQIESLESGDFRINLPRFQAENLEANKFILDTIHSVAQEKGVSNSQVALAWLLHKPGDLVPIAGTKREKYLIENAYSVDVKLSLEDMRKLDNIFANGSVVGERYAPAGMTTIDD